MLVDSSGALEILAGAGSWSKTGKRGTIAGLGISGTILKSGKAEIVNDVHQDSRFLAGKMPIRSLMCAPLKIHDKCIGVINVSTLERHTYTAEDLKLLSSVAGQAAALIENAKLYGELQETFFSTVNVLAEDDRNAGPIHRWAHPQGTNVLPGHRSGVGAHSGRSRNPYLGRQPP